MKVHSIKIHNFRQFKDIEIQFSTDPERNVTIIQGDNSAGKTTLSQAFIWCLYGETNFYDQILLNRDVINQMNINDTEEVFVELVVSYAIFKYTIKRNAIYSKKENKSIVLETEKINMSYVDKFGETKQEDRILHTINNILPKDLHNYFFFDGERLDSLSKNVEKRSTSFSKTILGLTGLGSIQSAMKHLKSNTGSKDVIREFRNLLSSKSQTEINSLRKDIEKLEVKRNGIKIRNEDIDSEIKSAMDSKLEAEEAIKEFEKGMQLQKEKNDLEDKKITTNNLKNNTIRDTFNIFNSDFSRTLALGLLPDILESLKDVDVVNKNVPEMHASTIEYIINSGTCICGEKIEEGDSHYEHLMSLQNILPPNSTSIAINSFVNEIKTNYSKPVEIVQNIINKTNQIDTYTVEIDEIEQRIIDINSDLQDEKVMSKYSHYGTKIADIENLINELNNEKFNNAKSLGEVEEALKQKKKRLEELANLDKMNAKIYKYIDFSEKVYKIFEEIHSEKVVDIKKKLESYMENIMEKIFHEKLIISIDEKYNIKVVNANQNYSLDSSSAQKTSLVFSFISAIALVAKENYNNNTINQDLLERINNEEEIYEEDYAEPTPFIMDAPLSTFDSKRIKAISEILPTIADQIIIIIKDTDGNLAEEYINDKISKKYVLKKQNEVYTTIEEI